MVLIETLKAAYNRGTSPQLSFYRDKSGLEIDLIRKYQRRPFAMEIKAGSTYVPDMTRPLQRFRSIREDLAGAALLYGGDEIAAINGIKIVPYTEMARLLFKQA